LAEAQGMFRRLGLFLALIFLAGCDNGSNSLLPVSGKVTYKGAALQGGIIVFTPDGSRGGRGAMALGEIHLDGTYNLRTEKAFGAAAGWYRVTVAAVSSNVVAGPGQRFGVPASLLPERYRDPELSRLLCEIKPDRANTIDFNLD
jgi:hypothetical protein